MKEWTNFDNGDEFQNPNSKRRQADQHSYFEEDLQCLTVLELRNASCRFTNYLIELAEILCADSPSCSLVACEIS